MEKNGHLNRLIAGGEFRLAKLDINGIDNGPVLRRNSPRMAEEEICLFHRDVPAGDDYFKVLHGAVLEGLSGRKTLPVVRFADGEYAFYGLSLHCNGLYRQAESVESIKRILPFHIEALHRLAGTGKIAPLIYPGNITREKNRVFSFFHRPRRNVSALEFVEFIHDYGIALGADYIPFYAVYAYLTSRAFARLVDHKKVCIINSEYRGDECRKWFDGLLSRPLLSFVEISGSYVATQWPSMKDKIMKAIPEDTDLCLVGAGVGALLVCVDVAETFSIPTIDAGHVLNMMNGREDKSKGPRLYTIWKDEND